MSKVEPPTGSQPVEISAQIVSPFLTMPKDLKAFKGVFGSLVAPKIYVTSNI